MTPFAILAGFFACAVTSLAFGIAAIRALKIELTRLECAALGYVLGSAVNSTLTLALGSLWVARKGVFLIVAGLALILLARQFRWVRGLPATNLNSIPLFFKILFAGAWLAYGTLYFRYALAPEVSPDGVAYHLAEVNLWAHAHGLLRLKDMYAALPQGVEMLYLFAFTIGRHSAAALVHFSFLMLLPVLMALYGIRFGFSGGAAVAASIVVFATPLIGWDGSSAYNDVALAVAAFACVYLLQMWRGHRQLAILLGSCIAAGFAFAIKYTGCFLLLFVALTVVWELRRERAGRIVRTVLIASAAMTILAAPYFVRNWIWFQNPVAFFGDTIFRNPAFHVSFERTYIEGQVHLNGVTWRDIPLNLTVGGTKLPESFGAIYLLAPIALAGLFWRETRLLVLAALFLACAYPENKSARFLIPAAPLLFLAVVSVVRRLPGSAILLAGLSVIQLYLCWPTVVKRLDTPKGWTVSGPDWKAAWRREPEDAYLRRKLDDYPMSRIIESLVPEGETVFALQGRVAFSYTTHPIMDSYRSADAEKAVDLLYSNSNSYKEGPRRWTATFPAARVRELEIVQTAASKEAYWIVNEIRLWNGGTRLAPGPAWHADAFPFPWDIRFAFDGALGTRWKSWEPMRPGMWIKIHFDVPQSIDRLDAVSIDGQWDSKPELRVQTAEGKWLKAASEWHSDPPVDARRDATRELKQEGIHFIVIPNQGWRPELFTADPAAWGMRLVGRSNAAKLYRID